MQRPTSSAKGEVKRAITNEANETSDAMRAGAGARENDHLTHEPVAERSHRISVGTEQLADEDLRYSNVACTD